MRIATTGGSLSRVSSTGAGPCWTGGSRGGATVRYFGGEVIGQVACLSGEASERFSERIQTLHASVVVLRGRIIGMLHHSLSVRDAYESIDAGSHRSGGDV